MAGHNKWSKIKNKKGKEDAHRGKVFAKLSKQITVAAKRGRDPEYNPSLKNTIEKAKAENMPNDNIERAIKKADQEAGGLDFEELLYEGYGPEGVAIMVSTLTDNRNRTAPDLRHIFDKNSGKLATNGSVSYQFEKKGLAIIEDKSFDEDELIMLGLEAGAEDVINHDGFYEFISRVEDFPRMIDSIKDAGYELLKADISYLAQNMVSISDEENIKKMERLIESLEDNDDVQDVYHNWDE